MSNCGQPKTEEGSSPLMSSSAVQVMRLTLLNGMITLVLSQYELTFSILCCAMEGPAQSCPATQYVSEARYVLDSTTHPALPQFLQMALALLVVSALCLLKFFPCPDFSCCGSRAPESDTESKPEAVCCVLSCQLHDLWSHSDFWPLAKMPKVSSSTYSWCSPNAHQAASSAHSHRGEQAKGRTCPP